MNLVLITESEITHGLSSNDERTQHLCGTVGLKVGDTFYVGVANGRRGLAKILALSPQLTFAVVWEKTIQPRLPLKVIVGLPRPQTAKKVLHDLASLGVDEIIFFQPEKGDPGYATSSLWKNDEWLDSLKKGAEQACSTHLPKVQHFASLKITLETLPNLGQGLALDPYEATEALGVAASSKSPVTLALGPERGWSANERVLLREKHFQFYHLGDRILRVEAAALVGSALVLSQMKVWHAHQPLNLPRD